LTHFYYSIISLFFDLKHNNLIFRSKQDINKCLMVRHLLLFIFHSTYNYFEFSIFVSFNESTCSRLTSNDWLFFLFPSKWNCRVCVQKFIFELKWVLFLAEGIWWFMKIILFLFFGLKNFFFFLFREVVLGL